MLGKLLKYEFKSRFKIQYGILVAMLIASGVFSFVLYLNESASNNIFLTVISSVLGLGLVGILIAIFAVFVIGGIMDYKDRLLGEEAYLTHTIPVSTKYILISKYVYDFITSIAIGITLYAALAILFRNINLFDAIKNILNLTNGEIQYLESYLSLGKIIFVCTYFITGLMVTLQVFYCCMSIGYSFSTGKAAKSVLTYVIIYMINQVVSFVLVLSVYVMKVGSVSAAFSDEEIVNGSEVMHTIYIAMFIFSIISMFIYIIIQHRMLTKKLCLQ